MRTATIITFLLIGTLVLPFVSTSVEAADSEDVVVYSDASEVELYLLGSDSNKVLTPFLAELGEESQSVKIQNSYNHKRRLGNGLSRKHGKGKFLHRNGRFPSHTSLAGQQQLKLMPLRRLQSVPKVTVLKPILVGQFLLKDRAI